MSKKKIKVKGVEISIIQENGNDYVNITDIAKQAERKAGDTINDWLKNAKTLLFLETWETLHNPNFKVLQMQDFRLKVTKERFYLSVQKYIKGTDAIGLISKSGRYGERSHILILRLIFADGLMLNLKCSYTLNLTN